MKTFHTITASASKPPWVQTFGDLLSEDSCDFVVVIDSSLRLISATPRWSEFFRAWWSWPEGATMGSVRPAPAAEAAWFQWVGLVHRTLASSAVMNAAPIWCGPAEAVVALTLTLHPLRDGRDRVIGVLVQGHVLPSGGSLAPTEIMPGPPPPPTSGIAAWVNVVPAPVPKAAGDHWLVCEASSSIAWLLGVTDGALTGRPFFSVVAATGRPGLLAAMESVQRSGQPAIAEFGLGGGDDDHPLQPVIEAFIIPRGADGLQLCLRDNTALRVGQQLFSRHQQHLETLLHLGADTVAILDASARITYLNRPPAGLEGASVVGRRAEAFVAVAHRTRVRAAIACTRDTGESCTFECRTNETAPRWLIVRLARLSAGRAAPEFVAVVTDITPLRRADEARRRLAALIEHSPDAIIGTAGDGVITDWGQGAEALFGRSAAQAVGRSLLDFVPAEERARELAVLDRALAGRATPAAEGRRVRHDGEIVNVIVATFPNQVEGGAVSGVTQVVRDVSTIRTLEAQLEHAQRLAAQGRLAAAAAHEITNCLAVIHGNASILSETVENPELARRIAALLHAARLGDYICGQLRDLARPQPVRPECIDLVATAQRVFLMLERIVRQRMELQVTTDHPLTVFADPGQVDQILVNLVLNARDATPLNGAITIRVGLAERNDDAGAWRCLEVADNGTGIAPSVRQQLFKTFFTTKTQGQGTGLGLATVLRLVRGMGGDVELASELGQGTRVSVVLPPPESPAAGGAT